MRKVFTPFLLVFFLTHTNNGFSVLSGTEDIYGKIFLSEKTEISAGAEYSSWMQKEINYGSNLGFRFTKPLPSKPVKSPDEIFTIEGLNMDEDATTSGFYHIPPDPIGAAGPLHVVSVVNTSIEWFTKLGVNENTRRLGKNSSTDAGSFFENLSPLTPAFDPKVIYDQYDERFIVVAIEKTDVSNGAAANTSRILVAVSDDNDPNGTWYFHAINSIITIDLIEHWADYPGLAVDDNVIYITANMFEYAANGGDFGGVRLWIINKTPLYTGGSAIVSVYNPFAEAVVPELASTTQPAHMFGSVPGGVGTFLAYYTGLSDGLNEYVGVIRVDDPLGTPVFSNHFVAAGDIDLAELELPDAPQMGSDTTIEVNDRRALNAVWRDDFLWVTTTLLPPSGIDMEQTTAHWFKINTSALNSLTLDEQGNVGGEDITLDTYTFYPSLAVNAAGDMVIGFAASGSGIFPGAYFAARLSTDTPGTVGSSRVLKSGMDFYIRKFSGSKNRWGDYSGISVDPSDGSVFWVFNQYALTRGTIISNEDGRWGTAFGQVHLTAIPVELTSFTAKNIDNYVELRWTTASEINNFGFEIERSRKSEIRGQKSEVRSQSNLHWEKICFVEGHGSSTEPHNYLYIDKNTTGVILYRLKQIDYDGSHEYSDIVEVNSLGNISFGLSQNYPNPFNPVTKISYTVPQKSYVTLKVFDLLGNMISELVNEKKPAGIYEVEFEARSLSSGVYFYKIEAGEFTQVKKMILMQ